MAAGPVSVGLKAEALSLYRQVHRIVKRLGEGATLYIRDFTHDGAPDIHYSLRGAQRALLALRRAPAAPLAAPYPQRRAAQF